MRRIALLSALALTGCVASISVNGTITLDGEPAPGWLVVLGDENSAVVYGDSFTDIAGDYRLKFTNLRGCDLAVIVWPPDPLFDSVENDEGGLALLDCGDHHIDFAFSTITPD